MTRSHEEIPRGNLGGLSRYFRHDFLAGFLVFLIALPLCLAIARASGFPPIAGIFTAIVGSILCIFFSNSELTIKGPAAGLIVIVLGCIQEFGGDGAAGGFSPQDLAAYKAALAVSVAAAVLQMCFGLFRGGILGEFFPHSAVHGMLAAIGVIIILKQLPVTVGVEARGEPLELLADLPNILLRSNPAIACIGLTSLLIMGLWPLAGQKVGVLRKIPSPMIVLLAAIPMGMGFDLLHKHSYVLQGHEYQLGEQYLVAMPGRVFGMFDELTFPDFSVLSQFKAWKWAFMFFMIGSLESLLSAKAIDLLDPWKRKSDLNRDLTAIGAANLCVALIGGLPMISEIVRSKANIMNGARTRFAGMWHGGLLLVCVALAPMVLHRIPLAALAAMLVYTGFRLAHPTEFLHVYRVGREQLVIFLSTLIAVLATDLLIGIVIGIFVKVVIHAYNGVPLSSLFRTFLDVEQQGQDTCLVRAHGSAVFSNWIPIRRQLEEIGIEQRQNVILDLSNTRLVDHSVMEKLHGLQMDFEQAGLALQIIGLDSHQPVANHEHAARRRRLFRMRRLTVVTEEATEAAFQTAFQSCGANEYSVSPCRGVQLGPAGTPPKSTRQVRLEAIITCEICDRLLTYLREELTNGEAFTASVEPVDVVRRLQSHDSLDLDPSADSEVAVAAGSR